VSSKGKPSSAVRVGGGGNVAAHRKEVFWVERTPGAAHCVVFRDSTWLGGPKVSASLGATTRGKQIFFQKDRSIRPVAVLKLFQLGVVSVSDKGCVG
jgi:hypothetical protein